MDIKKLTKLDEAPPNGSYLIYTRNNVYFDNYQIIDEVKKIIEDEEILEIHLFDRNKEYRMVATESKRYPQGVIEYLISDSDEKKDFFIDKTKADGGKTLNVINYIAYSEDNGMACIDDFRLCMGEMK